MMVLWIPCVVAVAVRGGVVAVAVRGVVAVAVRGGVVAVLQVVWMVVMVVMTVMSIKSSIKKRFFCFMRLVMIVYDLVR